MTIQTILTALLLNWTTILLLCFSSLLIWLYFSKFSGPNENELFQKRNVKHANFGNIFIETIKKTKFHTQRDEIFKREGKILGAMQMGRPTIFIAIPDVVQQVLSKYFTSFTNRRSFKVPDPIISNTIFMIENEKWKRCRSIMTPTFSMSKLRLMKLTLDETIQTYVNNFDDAINKSNGQPIELKAICGAFTMDSIVRIAFGIKVESLMDPNNPLLKHARSIFQRDLSFYNIFILCVCFLAPPIAKLFNLRPNSAAIGYFSDLSRNIIKNKREMLKNSNNNNPETSKATNFIELLIDAENERIKLETEIEDKKNNSGKAIKFMTDDEILAQCVLFFMVGYDTTATIITLTLYHLTCHPEYQERLYEEIMNNIEDIKNENHNQENFDPIKMITFDRIQKMKFLEAVIKETLRVYPPVIFTERVASEDVTLENGSESIYIKKDDVINIPVYSIHRDPNFWENPDVYNPDRFMESTPSYHKYSYLPFGSGPRDCIAKGLAYLETKMAVLHAVRMFKFIKCDKTTIPVEFYFQPNMLINKNVLVNLQRRD